jgi:hypothetical protein
MWEEVDTHCSEAGSKCVVRFSEHDISVGAGAGTKRGLAESRDAVPGESAILAQVHASRSPRFCGTN